MDTFEVGIVGASVAGSICAKALAEAGIKVALFDNSYPREKACGGLIDARTVEEFEIPKIYLENEVKWCITQRYFFHVKLTLEPSAFLVSRKDFDNYLLKKALGKDSISFYPERVNFISKKSDGWLIKTSRNASVRAKYLIGADGCPSLVRKQVFQPINSKFIANTVGYIFPCSNEYFQDNFEPNTVEAYYSHKYVPRQGFLWIFPKKNSINVGIGGFAPGKQLKESLDRFLVSHPAGKRLIKLKGSLYAGLVPTMKEKEFFDMPCTGNDWALIGDAAGHVNSINGAGIYYAMRGGLLCAKAFLNGNLRSFEKIWREDYGQELYFAANNMQRYYGVMGPFFWLQYFLAKIRW